VTRDDEWNLSVADRFLDSLIVVHMRGENEVRNAPRIIDGVLDYIGMRGLPPW
jgi:hypothetical protein